MIAVTALAALGSSNCTLIVVIGVVFTPIVARTVRAAVLGERELDYVQAARLRGERRAVHHVRRDPAERHGADRRRGDRPARATRSSPSRALTFLGFGVQPPSPDWSLQISDNYTLLNAGTY